VLSPLGKVWRPYLPRVRGQGQAPDHPVSVLTVPALSRWAGRDAAEDERLAALGERLFSDKGLSKDGKRSCATCHVPDKAYSDGKARPESLLPGTPILRNTPTLLYAALEAAQFWDGRALSSERQALLVMHSKAEMDVQDSAFPAVGAASAAEAAAALAAFQVKRLVPASSPLDRFARGDEKALSDEERAGFDVFAGKGRCGRCHVPPSFGGAHPPDFSSAVYSVLGVPETAAGKALDPDRGRAAVTRREIDNGAFKTPTLRNAGRTAPYFHHGAFGTLESVIDFYDKGGGKGLGLAVPNQDPDVVPLKLTEAEKRSLARFLRSALSDGR
jgi:cytochrome c peroxidase